MLNELKKATNVAYTENGAKMYKTTNDSLLDFFAQIGAMRNRDVVDIVCAFDKALAEDELLATKLVFHARNCRGGLGERSTFRICLKHLACVRPEIVKKNMHLISEFGRWDDVLVLLETPLIDDALNLIEEQLVKDMNILNTDIDGNISLCAKWMPSTNTSSKKVRNLARAMSDYYGISERGYRKILSKLRKKINLVESKMAKQDWAGIEYDKVPSQAGLLYRNAFLRHDFARYSEYLDSVNKGEAKINSGVLFPYEIMRRAIGASSSENSVLEAMWNNLPDYIGDSESNAICVVDTSGSMTGLPIDVAISLGMYCAERLKSVFHNHFITFSNTPCLQEIKGTNFVNKVRNMYDADWGFSTNLEGVFDLILDTATKNNLPQSELPSKLFIISDMEFNSAVYISDMSYLNVIKTKFKSVGYEMPKIVFWNVDARNEVFPITTDDNGVQLVSGCSPSIFKAVLSNQELSAYDLMLDVLNQEMYDVIKV